MPQPLTRRACCRPESVESSVLFGREHGSLSEGGGMATRIPKDALIIKRLQLAFSGTL